MYKDELEDLDVDTDASGATDEVKSDLSGVTAEVDRDLVGGVYNLLLLLLEEDIVT